MQEYENTKRFLLKAIFQIGLKKFLKLKKVKNIVPWTYIIGDLNGEKIVGAFYEKELQKSKSRRIQDRKVIKKKGNKLYVKWKGYHN